MASDESFYIETTEFAEPSLAEITSISSSPAHSEGRPHSRITIESLLSESDDELIVTRTQPRSSPRKGHGKGKKSTGTLGQRLVESEPEDDGADNGVPAVHREHEDDETEPAVGNRMLLYVAMVSFSVFAIAEFCAAILAKSESLLGDSITMMVDGLTYGINLWADKAKEGKTELEKIKLDTLAPAISLVALVAVTIYITVDAAQRLSDKSETNSNDADPQVMWGFALVNLVLDFVNIAMFFVGKSEKGNFYFSCTICNKLDLNMLSAFAHVGADTLRSIAVLAAGIAADADYVSSDRADSIGAIVVSFAIALSCIPLVSGLWVQRNLLREMRAKDFSEMIAMETVGRDYASGTPPDAMGDSLLVSETV